MQSEGKPVNNNDDTDIYNDLLLISFMLAAIVFITLFFFTAPYGGM